VPEALRGDLAWVSVGGLLQLAESEACSGVVELPGAATVTLRHGRPVDARWGTLTGWPALLQALLTKRGAFRLEVGPPAEPARPPLADVSTAVLEGCRLADELDRLAPLRLRPVGALPAEGVARALAAAMDGDRTVAEVLARSAVPEALAVDVLLGMTERREIVEAAPPDRERARAAVPPAIEGAAPAVAAPAPPAAPDADELVDRAREAVRGKAFDAAADLFRRALALRPNDRVIAQNLHRVESLSNQSR
jgi:hypothetical protein